MQQTIQLHRLIDQYFAGETTLDDERRLRRLLASTTEKSPVIDRARAVMSFISMIPANAEVNRRRLFGPTTQRVAAAGVVIAALVGGALSIAPSTDLQPATPCYAMVEGTMLDDDNQIEQMMLSQLALMGDAANDVDSSVDSDLRLLSDLIE